MLKDKVAEIVKRNEEMTKSLSAVLVATVVLLVGVLLPGCISPPPPEPVNLTDRDGDGVPDQMEINGYFWKDSKFWQWDENEHANITYYQTDPTQFSTDQDPYSDGMEVSQLNMDQSVAEPGNHPLVPAYPDIYVSMVGFDVETKADITNSTGNTAHNAWTNSTKSESTMEHHWDVTVEAKTGTQGGWGVTVAGGGKYGTNNSITSSKSGFNEKDWKEATTMNPAEAAKIKLRVVFENRGTAPAENVIPTINIALGDKTINTYRLQKDKIINTLAVNKRSPETGEWVIGDKPKTLHGLDEIILTLDELKSIQLGVPLFLNMPQMDADVVKQNEKGEWETVDSWQRYKARIDSVSARITVDLGDGKMKDYRVYAKSPNGPQVKLRDALKWTVGCEETPEGTKIMGEPVSNWRIGFSENAIESVATQLQNEADNNVLDLVIDAGWVISIKAPSGKDVPEIVWCDAIRKNNTTLITALVIDDFAVSKVLFKSTPEQPGHEMEMEAGPRIGTYRIELKDYSVTGEERIEAINDRDRSITKQVDMPRPAPIADGLYVITSKYNNKSLYIKEDNNVFTYPYLNKDNQQWRLESDSGYYKITTGDKKKCLEVADGRVAEGVNVQQGKCKNSDSQRWLIEPAGDGYYKITARHSKKSLSVDTREGPRTLLVNVAQKTYQGDEAQKWSFQPPDSYPSSRLHDYYKIAVKDSELVLDESAKMVRYNHRYEHQWEIRPVGDGYFELVSRSTGEYLGIESRGNISAQSQRSGGDDQKWKLESVGKQKYKIVNKQSQFCLHSNGRDKNVSQEEYGVRENEQWLLEPSGFELSEDMWLSSGDVIRLKAADGKYLKRVCGRYPELVCSHIRALKTTPDEFSDFIIEFIETRKYEYGKTTEVDFKIRLVAENGKYLKRRIKEGKDNKYIAVHKSYSDDGQSELDLQSYYFFMKKSETGNNKITIRDVKDWYLYKNKYREESASIKEVVRFAKEDQDQDSIFTLEKVLR